MNLPLNIGTYIICSSDIIGIITGTSAFARVNYCFTLNHTRKYMHTHLHLPHPHTFIDYYHKVYNLRIFINQTFLVILSTNIHTRHSLCETTYRHTRLTLYRRPLYTQDSHCVNLPLATQDSHCVNTYSPHKIRTM